jgi:hypothetical protein
MLGDYIINSSILLTLVAYKTKPETFPLSFISDYIEQK